MAALIGKNEAKKREILSAASAAGVSVAFGAPIGQSPLHQRPLRRRFMFAINLRNLLIANNRATRLHFQFILARRRVVLSGGSVLLFSPQDSVAKFFLCAGRRLRPQIH